MTPLARATAGVTVEPARPARRARGLAGRHGLDARILARRAPRAGPAARDDPLGAPLPSILTNDRPTSAPHREPRSRRGAVGDGAASIDDLARAALPRRRAPAGLRARPCAAPCPGDCAASPSPPRPSHGPRTSTTASWPATSPPGSPRRRPLTYQDLHGRDRVADDAGRRRAGTSWPPSSRACSTSALMGCTAHVPLDRLNGRRRAPRLREEIDVVARLSFAVDDLVGPPRAPRAPRAARAPVAAGRAGRMRVRLAALEALNGVPTGMPVGARLRQREAVRLRQEGYSLRRIAAALGCARGTVEGDLARAAMPPRWTPRPPPPTARCWARGPRGQPSAGVACGHA